VLEIDRILLVAVVELIDIAFKLLVQDRAASFFHPDQ
jgi:hypothetical protein